MSVPVAIRALARLDILEAKFWHDARREGLGTDFAREVVAVLDRISNNPELYAKVWRNVRAAGVRRFGYVVYYRVQRSNVEVLAVVHGARQSSEWKRRG